MERDGLIRRTPDPADGRSSQILLTETARMHLPEACAALFQGNRGALRGFKNEEATQLVVLLTRLITNLDLAASAEEPSLSP